MTPLAWHWRCVRFLFVSFIVLTLSYPPRDTLVQAVHCFLLAISAYHICCLIIPSEQTYIKQVLPLIVDLRLVGKQQQLLLYRVCGYIKQLPY